MSVTRIAFTFFGLLIGVAWQSQALAQSYCVRLDGTKLYAKPTHESKVISEALMYTPLMGTGNHKYWQGIHFVEVANIDSQKYWVNRHRITAKASCLSINKSRTSLRSGPGDSFAKAKPEFAQRKDSFLDLGGEDGWTRVKDRTGATFWVNIDDTWRAEKDFMRLSFDNK